MAFMCFSLKVMQMVFQVQTVQCSFNASRECSFNAMVFFQCKPCFSVLSMCFSNASRVSVFFNASNESRVSF